MSVTKSLRAASSRVLPERLKSAVKTGMFRLASASGTDCSSIVKIGSFNGFDMAYRHGTTDELVLRQSFDHDIFFSGVPEYQPSESDVVLDVGAHIGTFAVLAASKVPRGFVYAIEACEDTFNFLRINAALNGAVNLSTHHIALSDRRGSCTLYYDTGAWGHSVVRKLSNRSESVECCSLQQFFEDHDIRKCSFIKFNCEGAEFPILLGVPPAFLRRIRMILVLYHCDLWKANSKEDLISHLQASGFECKVRNCTADRGWIVAINSSWKDT